MSRVSTSMLLAGAAVRQARDDADPAAQRNAAVARACLQRCGSAGAALSLALAHAPGRWLLGALERLSVPAIGAHYAWRKRRIRQWALRACADGARQAIVLGAGFDALSLTLLAQAPELRAFEIERAPTLAIKRAALQALGLDDPRLSLVAADLGTATPQALADALAGFDPQCPTVIVAEGVLMYLDPEQVGRLLRALARLAPGAQLIATAMQRAGAAAPGFLRQRAWVNAWLARAGEPFRWGESRDGLRVRLGAAGLNSLRLADPDDPADPDPAPGEWLFAGRLGGANDGAG